MPKLKEVNLAVEKEITRSEATRECIRLEMREKKIAMKRDDLNRPYTSQSEIYETEDFVTANFYLRTSTQPRALSGACELLFAHVDTAQGIVPLGNCAYLFKFIAHANHRL